MSFETAAKRMSADVLSFAAGSSSLKKGESLRDTVETIEAIGIDAVIIRHASSGVPARVAGWVDHCSVVNAGDGWHQHPTQALLDLYTVRQALGGGDAGMTAFEGLQVLIVGDIRHSRVARSQVTGYAALGAEVTLVAPATLLPPSLEGWPVAAVSHRLDEVLEKADVVSLLRVQSERGSGAFVPTLREYTAGFGLTARRAATLPPGALILHPGSDRPRRRDRLRRRRAARLAHHRAGEQRGGRPHGGAVPPARPGPGGRDPPWLNAPTRTTGASRPSTVVLRGGTVVDQTGERVADVLVVGDRVTEVGPIDSPPKGARVLDAGGCVVAPGLVDLHTHLRQPGREEAETVETGARAASLGGFTAVVAMPNTEPALDSAESVRTVLALAASGPRPRWRWPGPSPWAGPASGWLRWPSWPGSGVRHLHRRRDRGAVGRADAPGPRVRQRARGDPGPALRGRLPGRRRGHARGGLVQPAGHPGHAGAGRGGHGGPGPGPGAGRPAAASTSSTSPRPARSSWCAGPRPRAWP